MQKELIAEIGKKFKLDPNASLKINKGQFLWPHAPPFFSRLDFKTSFLARFRILERSNNTYDKKGTTNKDNEVPEQSTSGSNRAENEVGSTISKVAKELGQDRQADSGTLRGSQSGKSQQEEQPNLMSMEYLNQFHKESTERCLKEIADWQKHPRPSKEAAKMQFDMHKRIKEQYPDPNQKLEQNRNRQDCAG